jgi:hypothetical protein
MDIKKVYGPYTRKDNRQHVCVHYQDGTKRTVSINIYEEKPREYFTNKMIPPIDTGEEG